MFTIIILVTFITLLKVLMFSQWTKMLDLIAQQLKNNQVGYERLEGMFLLVFPSLTF